MIKNGDKCMFANPLFKGYTAMNEWGGMPDSVEDAESSPASWHLPSTVASSELVITDNSGKPVYPDKVSVTSISGTVYRLHYVMAARWTCHRSRKASTCSRPHAAM